MSFVFQGFVYFCQLVPIFLLWTLTGYLAHRIAHLQFNYNLFRYFHLAHHTEVYPKSSNIPSWFNFLWVWEKWRMTGDAMMTETIPALLITYYLPRYGLPILVFHYFYEIFLSDGILDHNENIKGPITKVFAIGEYHLKHHKRINGNYGIYITLWDYVFGTNY